jgi:hypothetical protein
MRNAKELFIFLCVAWYDITFLSSIPYAQSSVALQLPETPAHVSSVYTGRTAGRLYPAMPHECAAPGRRAHTPFEWEQYEYRFS